MALTRIGSVGLATGIDINAGVGTFTGNLTVGGVLTYEDVTNVDSIGIITARAGVKVGSGITLSSDGDIFATGITTVSGDVKVGSGITLSPDGDIFFTGIITGNGSGLSNVGVDTGVVFTDKLSIGDGTGSGGDQINIGIGSDLKLYHDGTNSYIRDVGTGVLRIASDQVQVTNTAATEVQANFIEDGAVELYHNNLKKLETASGGVTVTGTLSAADVTTTGGGTSGIITATSFVSRSGQFSHRNLIINGAMNVAERGTTSTSQGFKTVDRFAAWFGGTDEAPTQSTFEVTAPSSPYHLPTSGAHPYREGFRQAFGVTNGNQTSGAGAGDYVMLRYKVEAKDIANSGWDYTSASSYITLSFWVKSSAAQNFYCRLETADGTGQNYPFETGSLTAFTWTKITKTIPGNANLTFNDDNGNGLEIHWEMFRGTDFTDNSVSNETWAAYASGTRTKDATSTWYTTNDASFQITGVQLEVGPVATPFEHRSFQDELLRCQRYYYAHKGPLWGHVSAGDHLDIALYFPVPMRATPSFNQVDTSLLFKNRLDQGNSTSASTYTISGATNQYGAMWIARPGSGDAWDTSDGRIYYYHVPEGTTSYEWSAEL